MKNLCRGRINDRKRLMFLKGKLIVSIYMYFQMFYPIQMTYSMCDWLYYRPMVRTNNINLILNQKKNPNVIIDNYDIHYFYVVH